MLYSFHTIVILLPTFLGTYKLNHTFSSLGIEMSISFGTLALLLLLLVFINLLFFEILRKIYPIEKE